MNFSKVLSWLGINLENSATWWQAAVLVAIVVLVGIVNYFVSSRITSHASTLSPSLKRISLRTLQRLFAPIFALIPLSLTKTLLVVLGLAHEMIDIAISLAIALAIIRLVVYILRKTFPITPLLKTWESIFVVIAWGFFALYLTGALPIILDSMDKIAISFGQTRISLLLVAKTVISVSFFLLLALWVSSILERQLDKAEHLAKYLKLGISKTVRVILVIIAMLVSLDIIGFDLTALTVLGGALGVGIGFGLQRIASNFISGFILLFDRSIRPNDVITIGESFGWVKELRARYVVIEDRDGVETLIPNENLITSQVINWSYTDRNIRIKIPVQISYRNNPAQAMELMVQASQSQERVLKDPPAVARLMGFGDHGINLELRLWINDPQAGINNIRSAINLEIWSRFQEHNISIPFPQRDVHFITAKQKEG